MPCIQYPIEFQEGQPKLKALINSRSEDNAINLVYAMKLGFTTQKTNVRAQKIDGLLLKTYGIVSASFLL